MSEFIVYLKLGWFHIADFSAYDHMLFLLALCGIYSLKQFKLLLALVTAFTLGHSFTLILAANNWVSFPSEIIEFLIPCTILITAVFNVYLIARKKSGGLVIKYILTTIFGLIHGLGFSNYLKQLLGSEGAFVKPLLAFNLGIEVGQVLIVAAIMLFGYILNEILKIRLMVFQNAISAFAGVVSIFMIYNTKFW